MAQWMEETEKEKKNEMSTLNRAVNKISEKSFHTVI